VRSPPAALATFIEEVTEEGLKLRRRLSVVHGERLGDRSLEFVGSDEADAAARAGPRHQQSTAFRIRGGAELERRAALTIRVLCPD